MVLAHKLNWIEQSHKAIRPGDDQFQRRTKIIVGAKSAIFRV